MQKHKKKKYTVLYNTDTLASVLFGALLRDFRNLYGTNFRKGWNTTLSTDLKKFRELKPPCYAYTEPAFFKANAQVDAFLSKYRFANDVFSDEDLVKKTLQKYFEDQVRIAVQPDRGLLTSMVLKEARKIAKDILGEYSETRLITLARFGKKSSIGCPLSLAHLDIKLSWMKAFTGSSSISAWFKKKVLSEDLILNRFLKRTLPTKNWSCESAMHQIESLVLKLVPKKWDKLRVITPLALLNLFYSFGFGLMVTEQLKQHGLDISKLQHIHRMLVRKFSLSRSHATVDLSTASDSITSEILNLVLPRPWYVGLKKVLTHQILYDDGKQAYTASVLPMGNGATFPLETLIFYSVIKAIGNLTHIDGIYSVYGDDMIYPSRLHRYVTRIFPELGFKLNLDKTFVSTHFRESCGADYFHGVDVRPFTFPDEHQMLSRSKYAAFLYKVYNGLCLRWDPAEIRGTLYVIIVQLAQLNYEILRVPPSYPATAGIHVDSPTDVPLGIELPIFSPISGLFENGSCWWKFTYLLERANKRFVAFQEPYYWLALQGCDDQLPVDYRGFPQKITWQTFNPGYPSSSEITWKRTIRYRKFFDKRLKKRRSKKIVRHHAQVAEKLLTRLVLIQGSVSDWI